MSENQKSRSQSRKSASGKPAGGARIRRKQHEPDIHQVHLAERLSVRRKSCTLMGFWSFCRHTTCRRTHRCVHPSNECFELYWPMVPETIKQMMRAGIDARAAGLPDAEVCAAMDDAVARCEAAQALQAKLAAAPVPPRPVAAPEPVMPRIRVL